MNQNLSIDASSSRSSADSISRRAYELWEQEGRPEGSDLRHWLQAEREISGQNGTGGEETNFSVQSRQAVSDARPLQGTRAGAAANRNKRSSQSPFSTEKSAPASGGKSETSGRVRV